ncbi:MAG: hypothetical protein KDE56_04950 [Anaerolineales bacterium]|nr:hypothetical protein [Anaerolineales bacterium]
MLNPSYDTRQKTNNERRLPSWREMNWDTSPEAETILFRLWREAPAWRKLEMMEGLNRAARELALMGLQQRFPNASTQELRRRLAQMTLGEELATRVYGPVAD